jgi:outer membrane receptor for ferrienterochelin and colicins
MKTRLVLCWLLVSLGLGSRAFAEDTSELEGLLEQSVVSAASKSPESASTAPAMSVSLSADEIRQHGMRTIDEAINFLAMGMQLEKFYYAAEIGSRGVLLSGDVGAHVLLLVDGHAVNEAWGATAYYDRGTGVPMELIDHIELIIGPGSVLYGSNAMLGVVNIVTKRGKDFSGAHLVVESELPINLRAAVGYGREFRLFGRDAEVVAEIEQFEQDGPTLEYPRYEAAPDAVTGEPRRYSSEEPVGIWGGPGDDASAISGTSGYLRLRADGLELGLRGMLYRRSHPADSGNFDDPDSFVRDRWLSADIKYSATLNEVLQGSVRLYGDHYDFRQDWGSYGAADCLGEQMSGCLWRLLGRANWAGVEPQLHVDWLQNRSLVTLLGIDGRIKNVGSNVNYYDYVDGVSTGAVGAFEEDEQSLGAYVQNTYWPVAVLGLNLGARFDVDSRFGHALSPRAAATLLPWSGATLKLIYAEAFRAPTAWDVYYTDPRSQIAGGDHIEPEGVRSVEMSLEQRFGSQRVFAGVFRSWWQDLVLLQDLSDVELADAITSGELLAGTPAGSQLRNVSNVDSHGINAGYYGALAGGTLRYGLSVTHAVTRISEPGGSSDVLPVAAPTSGNARISFTLPRVWPTLALAARYVSRRPLDEYAPDNHRFVDPQLELRAALTGDLPLDGLSYRLSANYSWIEVGPYAVGARPADDSARPLVPVDRFRIGVGLQYDLFR